MGFFPGKASEYRRKRRSLTGTVPGKECFMKSYTIHLIRHGICEGNLEGRYVGRTQSPLAREGMQALLELKRTGVYPEAVKYYASP